MQSAVVLTLTGQYWGDARMQRVLRWWAKNKIRVLVADETKRIRSEKHVLAMPVVVQLLTFRGYLPKRERIPWSDGAVYHRDDNVCQYCGTRCTVDNRTLDHAVPRGQGGGNGFENTVCACKRCNERKGNRTPQQAQMHLRRQPFVPRRDRSQFVTMRFVFNPRKVAHRVYVEHVLGGVV